MENKIEFTVTDTKDSDIYKLFYKWCDTCTTVTSNNTPEITIEHMKQFLSN